MAYQFIGSVPLWGEQPSFAAAVSHLNEPEPESQSESDTRARARWGVRVNRKGRKEAQKSGMRGRAEPPGPAQRAGRGQSVSA